MEEEEFIKGLAEALSKLPDDVDKEGILRNIVEFILSHSKYITDDESSKQTNLEGWLLFIKLNNKNSNDRVKT